MGTTTTVREAIAIEKAGMDIVILQGSEAGGHRGNFMRLIRKIYRFDVTDPASS